MYSDEGRTFSLEFIGMVKKDFFFFSSLWGVCLPAIILRGVQCYVPGNAYINKTSMSLHGVDKGPVI